MSICSTFYDMESNGLPPKAKKIIQDLRREFGDTLVNDPNSDTARIGISKGLLKATKHIPATSRWAEITKRMGKALSI
ncbi:hypothetical protein ACFLZY_03050 [Patescibacteria group bacterium]